MGAMVRREWERWSGSPTDPRLVLLGMPLPVLLSATGTCSTKPIGLPSEGLGVSRFEFVVSARRLNVQTPFVYGSDGRGRCQQLASETRPNIPSARYPKPEWLTPTILR